MDSDKAIEMPLLISHRGAHKEAPENSFRAFEIALDYGVDGIETDVQLSKDGVPVLFHNPTASRLTGSRKRISSYTWEQLRNLELGADGSRIPTLAETLAVFGGRTRLLIEIKSRRPDRATGRWGELADKVAAAIACLPDAIQSVISILSFDPDVLERASRAAPQLKYVLNTDGTGDWCVPIADLMLGKFDLDFLSAVCLEKKKLPEQAVAWAHGRGLEVFTYCCNTRPQLERALAMRVDGIMSDKPEWLVSTVKTLRPEV